MGRPRKRRREEEGVIHDEKDGRGAVENGFSNETGDKSLHQYLAGVSGNGLATNDNQWFDNGLGANGFQDGDFDFPFRQQSGSDSILGFPAWDPSQDMNSYSSISSDNSSQSQKPSTTLDHDFADTPPTDDAQTGCSCLPKLYAVLASFQSMPAPSFPYSMGTLKKANRLGHEVVRCQICPQTYNTAVQNSMLLGTLLQMVNNEYAKLLKHIDERSATGDKIPFRVGEPSSPCDSRHTGMPDCPMALNIDLSGEDWRMIARKAIRQEILGNTDSNEGLAGLVDAMRNRQTIWHERYASEVHAAGHDHSAATHGQNGDEANRICVQVAYIDQLKKSLEILNL